MSAKSKQENNASGKVKPSSPKDMPRAAAGKKKGQAKRIGKGGRGSQAAGSKRGKTSRSSGASGSRLRPGGLDKIVLGNLRSRESAWPLTASAVAKGVGRSSGAVANCLARLEKDKTIRLAKRKPRSYDLKGVSEQQQPGGSDAKGGE